MLRKFIGCLLLLLLLTACQSCVDHLEERKAMPLLSPRIFAPDPHDTIVDLMPLRTQLKNYEGSIPEPHGIYFEYLPSGASIGLNERESFIEASLLKVPVVIKAYQLKNEGLLSLDDVMTMEQADIDRNFGSLWERGVGTSMTLREVIRSILQESDNTALQMLGRKMGTVRPGFVNEVFDVLDIPKEVNAEAGVVISPKNYTSILRSLYLAASLPKKDAQEVLGILTETKFNTQIPAGVPPGISVAHKVGVYTKSAETATFSDCGIVYVPRRPYALCMMIRGSEEHATRHMQDISRMIYAFISHTKATTYDDQ